MMTRSWIAIFLAISCVAVLLDACGTLTIRAPSTMQRPKTTALGSSVFDTLTQHNDPQRSGAYLSETRLTPATVVGGKFERLFDWEVDGQIYTQPLYVSHLPYQGREINLIVVATTNNSVYAFEAPAADSPMQPADVPLWHVGSELLGKPLHFDFFLIDWGILGHDIKPLIGITATPVIDRKKRGLVYVTVKLGMGGIACFLFPPKYRLFAIDLVTGKIVAGIDIIASVRHSDQTTKFDAKHHLQRPSLLEVNDRIYLAFGSHQDTKPYHGWLADRSFKPPALPQSARKSA